MVSSASTRYYAFDEAFVREVLGKKLSKGTKKDLDDISTKTGITLKSCRRQVSATPVWVVDILSTTVPPSLQPLPPVKSIVATTSYLVSSVPPPFLFLLNYPLPYNQSGLSQTQVSPWLSLAFIGNTFIGFHCFPG
jgi:hypothetical protein